MGGGVLRTAAKAAVLGGYRSTVTGPGASRPAATSLAAAGEVVPAAVSVAGVAPSAAVVQKVPSWEIDDWQFAGGKDEEELFDSVNPPARLVFGPLPTIEEANEATSDLKEAIEIAYFSSPSVDESQIGVSRTRALEAEYDTKICATNLESAVVSAMPTHAMQAFSLLQRSTEVQEAVASLAADKNVWAAVMKNEKVLQFIKNYRSTPSTDERVSNYEENMQVHENENNEEASLEDSVSKSSENSENRFSKFMMKIKMKISVMVNNLAEFFQDLLGTSPSDSSSTSTKTATLDSTSAVLGSSFFALAVGVIIVVLLKRG